MKYRPEFPDRLGCIRDSRGFAQGFFRWYNEEHYHSGLALLTPAMEHYQQTGPILQQRPQGLGSFLGFRWESENQTVMLG
jgi:putative transposase